MDQTTSPSSYTYKDRLKLKAQDGHSYNQLYSTTKGQSVFGRLYNDASGRQLRSSQGLKPSGWMAWPEYLGTAGNKFYSEGNLSGFNTNTCKAVYTHTTFKTGHQPREDRVPLEQMVPRQLRKYKEAHPMDYLADARPDTETTNQTMRMMGTYWTDFAHARRSGTFIPNVCPGGLPWHHPDVKLTGSAAGPGTLPHTLTRPHTVWASAHF